jgi:vacuolar iron transporter family protein
MARLTDFAKRHIRRSGFDDATAESGLGRQISSSSERHDNHGPMIRDIIIGFADGLTVPFALTAGLSS